NLLSTIAGSFAMARPALPWADPAAKASALPVALKGPIPVEAPVAGGPDAARSKGGLLANPALLTLMLGHCILDMYVGLLPILYPVLTHRFHLDLGTVGLISLAYSGMASISQPFFGLLAD